MSWNFAESYRWKWNILALKTKILLILLALNCWNSFIGKHINCKHIKWFPRTTCLITKLETLWNCIHVCLVKLRIPRNTWKPSEVFMYTLQNLAQETSHSSKRECMHMWSTCNIVPYVKIAVDIGVLPSS